jgi:hypothetical protein
MTKRSTVTLTSIAALALLLASAVAFAQPKKLGVGLYVPEIPFSNPAQRFSLVRGIAQHLSSALGVPVEGRAYKSAGDFERDLRSKKIQFAVVGAFYAATRRVQVVAKAQLKGGSTWSLMAKSKVPLSSLKGKVLQVPSMGPITLKFVENGLLDGVVTLKDHFKVVRAPDVNSAIAAVRFGRAQAVVAPTDTPGLVPLVGGIRVPPPAFAIVDRKLDKQLAAKATRAILSYGAAIASFQGWRCAGAGIYGAISGAAAKKVKRMVLSAARVVRLRTRDIIEVKQLQSELPRLEGLFWVP